QVLDVYRSLPTEGAVHLLDILLLVFFLFPSPRPAQDCMPGLPTGFPMLLVFLHEVVASLGIFLMLRVNRWRALESTCRDELVELKVAPWSVLRPLEATMLRGDIHIMVCEPLAPEDDILGHI